jgi:hypothetical protein
MSCQMYRPRAGVAPSDFCSFAVRSLREPAETHSRARALPYRALPSLRVRLLVVAAT